MIKTIFSALFLNLLSFSVRADFQGCISNYRMIIENVIAGLTDEGSHVVLVVSEIIENVIAGLTRNLLIVFGDWEIAGRARNDEVRQFESKISHS
jgi:hypothetical protein